MAGWTEEGHRGPAHDRASVAVSAYAALVPAVLVWKAAHPTFHTTLAESREACELQTKLRLI